ncbi:MAG: hypothetical protein AAGF06_02455 [Pseudomonadota bacterium]
MKPILFATLIALLSACVHQPSSSRNALIKPAVTPVVNSQKIHSHAQPVVKAALLCHRVQKVIPNVAGRTESVEIIQVNEQPKPFGIAIHLTTGQHGVFVRYQNNLNNRGFLKPHTQNISNTKDYKHFKVDVVAGKKYQLLFHTESHSYDDLSIRLLELPDASKPCAAIQRSL